MSQSPRVTICRSETFLFRRMLLCPTCKRKRRFVGQDAAWYGPTWTCCFCGDSFSDGERLLRPARRGWREEASANAKRLWNEAGPYDRKAHVAWLVEQIDLAGTTAEGDQSNGGSNA